MPRGRIAVLVENYFVRPGRQIGDS
jgi:hypothetical protein